MIKDRSTEIPSEEWRGLLSVFHFDLPFLIVGLMLVGSAGVIYLGVPETVQRKPIG